MSTFQDVYIVSAVRTPIASFRSSFSTLSSVDLGTVVAKEAIHRAKIHADDVEETIAGSVLTANVGQNVARQISIKSGIPNTSNAFTVNKVCSSSLKALILATQSIQLGVRNTVLVVGTESMSQAPFYLNRGEHSYGEIKLVDSIPRDGITDAMLGDAMGLCAEKTVKDYGISRQEQDSYALDSYKRAAEAWKSGSYSKEVVSVPVKQRRGPDVVISEDEEYKRLDESKLPTLQPAFIKDGSGTITAANASSLNDGAASIVVVSGQKLKNSSFTPLAKIIGYAEGACAPVDFTIAPVFAVKKLLEPSGISKDEIVRWEVNEAFSITALSFIKELGLDRNRVNVRGGAVALGHPIGMSGARIVVSLIHQLEPQQYGVAAICNGGGESTAVLIQRV